ncbi:glycoside hydrolase family 2 TIM barrel-domain containing protein [Fusibacter bizertensis]|uniref:Beta-galactosidase n=1 Tax=Fusibacter bizertensis TaxID=1488331 RepID=A0ABT6NC94_9FIRM|nr:glycoside hydrolase family 2 TIM barrel-domain containing protein [Fusibacter bizertensis]MDH8678047.1 glycoside hydrolase family 2 TIM barrel-domain containing protein [Fusibacter bizertensis]
MEKLHLMHNRIESRAYFKSKHENVFSLDGMWRFRYFDAPARIPEIIDFWHEIKVPSCWQLEGYDQMHYTDLYYQFPLLPPYVPAKNPTGVYERTLDVNEIDLDSRKAHRIRFHGVDSAFELWINAKLVGDSTGSRYTTEFDITQFLNSGENTIRVIVKKWSIGTYLEDQDMWWLSGIFRSVEWLILPKDRIEDFSTITKLSKHNQLASIAINVSHINRKIEDDSYEIEAQLCYRDEIVVGKKIKVSTSQGVHGLELQLEMPKLWTAETPFLYDLNLNLYYKGDLMHSVQDRIGIREIKVHANQILINGMPIHFKGVNRHDFNCDTGRTVSLEDMRFDLELMKSNHMNAVRTAHYPNSPEFYALCDEIGLYVISEADLECHGFELTGRYDWITDDSTWTEAYVDRAVRLVKRDINRPCIIMWSLGNESEFGRNFIAMAEEIRAIDHTRLIHYEGDRDVEVCDVYSTMYTRLERLEEIGKSTDGTKPHLLCEYAHAMGNGPGGLKEYQQLFRKYPRLNGGFIWEWIDHGIRSYDEEGRVFYKYGGDYGDAPHNGNFNCDGLLFPDRTPSPALAEVRKVYSPIWIESFYEAETKTQYITVENDYDHITLDHVCFTITGRKSGFKFKLHNMMPKEKVILVLASDELKTYPEDKLKFEAFIPADMAARHKGAMLRAYDERNERNDRNEKYEITSHQIISPEDIELKIFREEQFLQSKNRLLTTETHESLEIKDAQNSFSVKFDKIEGLLTSYNVHGVEFIKNGPEINFWRAPIDNDMYVKRVWMDQYSLHLLKSYPESFGWERETESGAVLIKINFIVGAPNQTWYYKIRQHICIRTEGTIEFDFYGQFKDPKRVYQSSIPKIGSVSSLAISPESVKYNGLGPLENYPDSQSAAWLGIHELIMEEMFTHYPYPQENGNRSEVTEIELCYDAYTFCIDMKKGSHFAIRPYSDGHIEQAKHMNVLKEEGCFLHLDYKVNGLGSNSCGPEPSPEHKLKPVDFEFGYTWHIKQR